MLRPFVRRVPKSHVKVFDNSRDTIENIPVDDQEVPDPRDSSISKTKDSFGPF